MGEVTEGKKFLWNMIGGISNASSSMILLIIVNRSIGADQGGIFSLAFAIAQMLITIATLEVRNYQSTDLREKYKFTDYYSLRILTCVIMFVVGIFYVWLHHYDWEKSIVVLLLCIYKGIEALSDVFEGMFQQHDRIDLAGKSMAYRVIISTVVFAAVIICSKNLIIASIALVVAALAVCLIYNRLQARAFATVKYSVHVKEYFGIIKSCIPIALGAFMIMYIANAPKYAIDKYLSLEIQNAFSIIFMPALIINLFSLFVFRPMLTSVTLTWLNHNRRGFLKIIGKAIVWMSLMTVFFTVCAYIAGIPVLSFIYGVDLNGYRGALVIIMLGGGLNALMTIFRFSLTAIREQNISLLGFIFSFIFSLCVTPYIVKDYGIFGAAISYVISMLVMNGVFILIMLFKIRTSFRNSEETETE